MAKGTKRIVKANSAADDTTLDEAFSDFIEQKNNENKSASTIRNYKQSFEKFYSYYAFNEDTLCSEITQQHFYKWAGQLKTEIKPSSVNHYLRDLRTFLYWCMEKPHDYIPMFRVKEIEVQEETPKLYSDEELDALLERPQNRKDFVEWRTYAIVNWICATGNRAGTLLSIKMKDLDLKNGEYNTPHTKNKKASSLPISSALKSVIKDYIKRFRYDTEPNDYLFCDISNNQLSYNALRLSFVRYCEERGVSRASVHSLRHNFAKAFIANGGSIVKLQEILGHATLEMTRHYVKMFLTDIKQDYEDYSLLDTKKKKLSRTKKIDANIYDE